ISALFWSGSSYKIWRAILDSKLVCVTYFEILEEVRNKLVTKFSYPEDQANKYIETIMTNSLVVRPTKRFEAVENDSTDNKIIEAAVEGTVKYIVSNDGHLLKLKRFENIFILSSKDFFKLIT
ncbi:MAG: putative toxin-antitoxin system toxin component, PIN family, partial [Candidatus Diapherotrites archaeon]|nr:putative toxin-antitoxin system toxin component, PIN family [Candidatus Diapherotrites archaeon]